MFLSVIIPVYNGEKYIEEAVNSVRKQPCSDLEIICVNDGSTDDTRKLLEKLAKMDNRISVYHQKNSGVAAARNAGIRYARGEYIAFLDADDLWVAACVDEQLKSEIEKSDVDIISFEYYLANENLTKFKKISNQKSGIDKAGNQCLGINFKHISSYFYKKSIIWERKVQFYGKRNEDERFRFLCLTYSKEILYVKRDLSVYRHNRASVTHQKTDVVHVLEECVVEWTALLEEKKSEQEVVDYCKGIINRLTLELKIATEEQHISSKTARAKFDQFINEKKIYSFINREEIWMAENEKKEWNLATRHPWIFHFKHYGRNKVREIGRRSKVLNYLVEQKRYPIKKHVGR